MTSSYINPYKTQNSNQRLLDEIADRICGKIDVYTLARIIDEDRKER